MTPEDRKALSEAYAARRWPAHLTFEQIIAQWKFERSKRNAD